MSLNMLNSPSMSLATMQAAQGGDSQALKDVKDAKKSQQVEDAAEQFEAVFIGEMIKPMFEGISTDGMFGGGKGEEVFRDMLVQEYGKLMAKNGGIGLSSQVKDAMIKMQEQADNAQQTSIQ